jgi:2-hydroxy-6-oxonona-2,4-dienedioate hydrolase
MAPSEGSKALHACFRDQSFEAFRRFFDLMLYNGKSVPDEILRRRIESINGEQLEAYRQSESVSGRSFIPDLPRVLAQTLIIHGRNDRVVSLEAGLYLLSVLRNSQLHMFNRCGHWVQYEHADEFNRMVLDFLDNDQPSDWNTPVSA